MTQERADTSKPQLKCRDCSIDVDKLLEEAEKAADATADQTPSRPALTFDLSRIGDGMAGKPKGTESGSDKAD
jgi:hypothetical protein